MIFIEATVLIQYDYKDYCYNFEGFVLYYLPPYFLELNVHSILN